MKKIQTAKKLTPAAFVTAGIATASFIAAPATGGVSAIPMKK